MKKIIFLSALVIIGILYPAQIKRGCLSLLILIDSVRSPEKAMMGKLIDGPTKTKVTVPGRRRVIHADLYRPLTARYAIPAPPGARSEPRGKG